ncbi:Cof-type HAD-IIB family hydrolase [Tessaracoccus flavus]|uniref:HAD family hydrolase n=1 Tax=Tessaracoccus flavus TaxID=1610493 RepID=A0A1Q2CIS9_9ACTN|nr:Cof-type HAD-IIB family hydrolase [Tessaracoccus flavus]AQP46017.1 hypothetical protein RPIT_04470 [Tessaracoccus flavus]
MVAVIAVDMDGTFLRPDDTYDRARFERLRERMRAQGVRFVVASGNQLHQLRSFFAEADGCAYVAENGHIVVDEGSTAPLSRSVLAADASLRVINALDAVGFPYVMSGTECAFVRADAPPHFVDLVRRYYHRLEVVSDLRDLDVEVMKFAMITDVDPDEVATRIEGEVGDVMSVVVSGPRDLDLNQPGVTKAFGLGLLLDRWGVSWDDVVAFGDGGNDVELLQAAGRGYAMEGARDELVAVASHRTGRNTDDAVLTLIEEILH